MSPQAVAKCLESIHLCRMRVTRLDSLGNVSPTTHNSYVTDKPIEFAFKPQIEAGEEKTIKGGCACIVASVKEPDLFKRFDIDYTTATIEPALLEMLTGASVVLDNSIVPVPIGNMWPDNLACGDTPPPLSAIECWSDAYDVDYQDPTLPYFYWVWPATKWSISDGSLSADFYQPKLSGYTVPNGQWDHGPYGGTVPIGTGGGYFLTNTVPPTAACGYATVSPSS